MDETTINPPSGFPDDPFAPAPEETAPPVRLEKAAGGGGRTPPPPPPPGDGGDEDDEESGMLRMSFLEHLEELRSRIIKALYGFGAIFLLCVIFSNHLFKIVERPGLIALRNTGNPNAHFIAIDPMEQFSIIWVWTPVVAALFLGSPWILYQVWAFISPGLYRREKRWAVPFVLCTAGLFIAGGLFAYFVAFRYGLAFLLGLGLSGGVVPMVTITSYFDLFVNVMLGVALVFEMPVIFFLTLLRLASPRWLLSHSRYAILAIVVIAAIVTPTPDVFNLMLFAVPMVLLYFVGVFASFLLVMHREGRRFPWAKLWMWTAIIVVALAALAYFEIVHYHMHVLRHWPFLAR